MFSSLVLIFILPLSKNKSRFSKERPFGRIISRIIPLIMWSESSAVTISKTNWPHDQLSLWSRFRQKQFFSLLWEINKATNDQVCGSGMKGWPDQRAWNVWPWGQSGLGEGLVWRRGCILAGRIQGLGGRNKSKQRWISKLFCSDWLGVGNIVTNHLWDKEWELGCAVSGPMLCKQKSNCDSYLSHLGKDVSAVCCVPGHTRMGGRFLSHAPLQSHSAR